MSSETLSNQATNDTRPEALVTSIVDELVAAMINARIYWSEHPRVVESTRTVSRTVARICADMFKDSITIATTKDYLVYEDRPLLGASLSASRLIAALRDWGSGGISVEKTVTEEDFGVLLGALHESRDESDDYEKINGLLGRAGRQNITLLPAYHDAQGAELTGREEDRVENADSGKCMVPVHLYQSLMELLQGVTVSVSTGGIIDFAPIRSHAEAMLRHLNADEGPLINLARQDQYDAFTFGHSVRVSVLALNFGRALTDDDGALIRLGAAALLHDVGKAKVPFEILHSTGTLNDEERREMFRHPEYGAQILVDHHDADPLAVAAAFGHHCCAGPRSYPKTEHGHEISLATSIVGIVDVFEALTAARPYKRPMSPIRAYQIMMGMKQKFDLPLLKRFIEVNGVYPCGQLLELSTGELARVDSQTSDLCRPRVVVITDRQENRLASEDQRQLDLGQQETTNPISIVQPLQDDPQSLVGD